MDLDGFFGLHPSLAPLQPLSSEGLMSFVHACSSGDGSRSHFEAMSAIERGLCDDRGRASSGWLARHLGQEQPFYGFQTSLQEADATTGVASAQTQHPRDGGQLHP